MAKEKRLAFRLSVNLPAELWGMDNISFLCGVRLIELSPGGCKISLKEQKLSLPCDLKIKFALEKANPFNFSVEILWSNKSDEKTYAGMKFKNLTMHDKEKIRKYIHDLKYINKDGYIM
ncbi:MAG: PilZ domain-containing protein [Elusimicrobia bacterium]|nr:PilZ domain-containing protein [Elusimicrobiota bacterium]